MGHLENTLDKTAMQKLSLIKMKLNQCYYKLAKVGLAFTMDMLKTKTFELAAEECKFFLKLFLIIPYVF